MITYNNIKIDNKPIYALVDCNQFYISCERAFAPHLENKLVGVLSNNDGCLVALSPELKKLGITRGMPAFQVREKLGNHKVYLFSSNYELYGDMSSRVMNILTAMADDIEIYSIDEAFLYFNNFHESFDISEYAKTIKDKVKQQTSIPISIGLAKTKTLAKIANHIAKKDPSGIIELLDDKMIENALQKIDISDIWGIGRQHTKRLNKFGIYTAADFVNAPTHWIRKNMAVNGERTQLELKGIPCIDIESIPPVTQSIVCSRSFGRPVSNIEEMIESVSSFTTRAIKNLRKKKKVARNITIFITTNPFKETRQYANFIQGHLPDYSAYTPDFINLAISLLKKIYKNNHLYKKSGVMLTDIIDENKIYPTIFIEPYGHDKRHQVMQVVDKINHKYGKEQILFASSGINNKWRMRRELSSPRCTTRWDELLVAKVTAHTPTPAKKIPSNVNIPKGTGDIFKAGGDEIWGDKLSYVQIKKTAEKGYR